MPRSMRAANEESTDPMNEPKDAPPEAHLSIHGMTCAGCVATVEHALARVPGVAAATVNLATEEARVRARDGVPLDVASLIRAVNAAGYRAAPRAATHRIDRERERVLEERGSRRRLAIALLFGIPLMGVHLAIKDEGLARWLSLLLATPIQFVAGWPFHARAANGLRHGTLDMNSLISLGTFSAYLFSLAVTVAPGAFAASGVGTHVYFDTAAMILVFLLIGRLLESRARRKTGDALRALLTRRPNTARRLASPRPDAPRADVALETIARGDWIAVNPGEAFPIDGVIEEGSTEVDESMLTGEPLPIPRSVGDPVAAGTINGLAPVTLRATRVGDDTTLARIARLVEEAQGGKAPIAALADRIAGRFVPVVVAIALLAAAAWLAVGPAPQARYALVAFVAVLIVACPCAMGLATPTAILAGTGAGARRGILIRGGQALERAGAITTVVFDKTGTLTRGEPEIVGIVTAPGVDARRLLALALAVEAGSEHPLARAVARRAAADGVTTGRATEIEVVPGKGAVGQVAGATVLVGTLSFAAVGGTASEALREAADCAADLGRTVVWVGSGLQTLGFLEAADTPREGAADAVRALKARGLRLVLATGDRPAPARRLAEEVGVEDVRAGLSPEDKVALVRALRESGEVVAMVGDGLNDAAALAASDLGIAIGTGTDVAIEAADITLVRGNLALIADALDLSRRTLRTIRENLFWAFAYNVIAIPVAAGALYPATGLLLHPTVASAAMALSSVSVVGNSARLAGWRGSHPYATVAG